MTMKSRLLSALFVSALLTAPAVAAPAGPNALSVPAEDLVIQVKKNHGQSHHHGKPHRHGHHNHRHHGHHHHHYVPGRRYGAPPPGWRRYGARPYDWRTRGCVVAGPVWCCP